MLAGPPPASTIAPAPPTPVAATVSPVAVTPAQPRARRLPPVGKLLGVAASLVGLIVVGWQLVGMAGLGGPGASPTPTALTGVGEIFLEPKDDVGPDPFTNTVTLPTTTPTPTGSSTPPPSPSSAPSDSAGPSPSLASPPVVQAFTGGQVGLYGGSLREAECDVEQLIAFLEEKPAKAAAWASVHGIVPSEIRAYIEGLTPVTLRRDTRVTNHGFRDGAPDPRQSVLQAGTAVLVDDRGVPRARCYCGNPLAEPIPVRTTPALRGPTWPGFSPADLTTISPAPAPLATIPVIDDATGAIIDRPVGTDGGDDTLAAASPSPTPEPTPEPTPSATTTPEPTPPGPGVGDPVAREPLVPSDLTGFGAVGANSVDPNFEVGGAVDGDLTTSWFSKGPHTTATVTTYDWTVAGPIEIGAIVIVGNGANETRAFRTGFGFEQVTIEVFRAGASVAVVTQSLAGEPDPRVLAEFLPGTTGDTVRLSFTGHESLDCGGIGELLVLGADWRADVDALAALGY